MNQEESSMPVGPQRPYGGSEKRRADPPASDRDPVLASVARERGLSLREVDVLSSTCLSRSTKEIADLLRISPKTVEYYWERMFKKLGCRSKVDAIALLYRRAGEMISALPPANETAPARRSAGDAKSVLTS